MTFYINGRFLTQKVTGVQRFAIEVIKELDKLKIEDEIIIVHPDGIINDLELVNIKKKKIGKFKGYFWEQISLPLFFIKHRKNSFLLNLCNIAPILTPQFVVLHDIGFKTHSEYYSKKFSFIYKLITRLNIKRYNHVFTDSNYCKQEIISNYKLQEEKITVNYCSANHMTSIMPDNSILKKLNLENKDFFFSLGSNSPHKNRKFIEKCASINKDKMFVISGDNNKKIFNSEEGANLDNLKYTGYLNDNELVALYNNCYAFIFPSLYEGFGIPPLEACICGCKKLVLSNIEVLKEVYQEDGNYVDTNSINNDELQSFFDNLKDANVIRLKEKYSWKNTAEIIYKTIKRNVRCD